MAKPQLLGLLLLLAVCSTPANAGVLSLTLDSRGVDLNVLEVGDDVTIDVLLDLMSVGSLTDLGATIELTPVDEFAGPSNATVGSIISEPIDLLLSTFPGIGVDAQFSTLFSVASNPNLTTSGVFFSFDLTADQVGSGVIAFDPFSLFAVDDVGNFYFDTDFDTNELSYAVSSGTESVIPEPASIAMFLVLSIAALPMRRRRQAKVMP